MKLLRVIILLSSILVFSGIAKGGELSETKGSFESMPNPTFLGEDMKLEPVILKDDISIDKLLSYYMGKNTQERQEFIINNIISE